MSEATTSPVDLHALEQELHNQLRDDALPFSSGQVHCVFRGDLLEILLRQDSAVQPDQQQTIIHRLQQFFQEKQEFSQCQILIGLQTVAGDRPYAWHSLDSLDLKTTDLSSQVTTKANIQHSEQSLSDDADYGKLSEPFSFATELPNHWETETSDPRDNQKISGVDGGLGTDDSSEPMDDLWISEEDEIDLTSLLDEPQDSSFRGFNSLDEGYFDPEQASVDAEATAPKGDRRFERKAILVGASLVIVVFTSTLYVLTRPCVLDRCQTIEQATNLAASSSRSLQENPSDRDIRTAHKDIQRAIKQLESIPFWSPRSGEARQYLDEYRSMASSLEKMVAALDTAVTATQMAQKTSLSASEWSDIAKYWQAAITELRQISPQDRYFSVAQDKVRLYQSYLQAVQKRRSQEKQALEIIASVKEAVKVAQVQQSLAQSPESWEQVYQSWSDIIQQLETIQPGTSVYPEAQQLLEQYVLQMNSSKIAQSNESFAKNVYNQGKLIANLALQAEEVEDWQRAVSHWRNAIRNMEQVPENSFQSDLAKSARETFNQSLSNAETQVQIEKNLKDIEAELRKICTGEPNICTYTLSSRGIDVRLTAAYVAKIHSTALQASGRQNSDLKTKLLDHVATFEQALQTISSNTGVIVRVYDTQNALLASYVP